MTALLCLKLTPGPGGVGWKVRAGDNPIALEGGAPTAQEALAVAFRAAELALSSVDRGPVRQPDDAHLRAWNEAFRMVLESQKKDKSNE